MEVDKPQTPKSQHCSTWTHLLTYILRPTSAFLLNSARETQLNSDKKEKQNEPSLQEMWHPIHAYESSLGGGNVNMGISNYFGPSLLTYPTPAILLIGTSQF